MTESFRERVIQKGVSRERVSVIPNGVDCDRYVPIDRDAASRVSARRGFLVGYIGTFGRGQGLEAVIEAASIIERTDPDVRFELVGDGPERDRLARAVRERGVSNVTLSPPVERDETVRFYNRCDVCLVPLADIPIFQETVPSKLFEVMACGRPVLGSVAGEAATIIRESRAGLTVTPGNAAEIAGGIHKLRAMPAAELKAMSAQAREYVARHYNRRQLADDYLALMRNITAGR